MHEQEIVDALTELRGFLTPGNWCKGHVALDSRGGRCQPWEPFAVRWCAMGALWKLVGNAHPVMRLSSELMFLNDASDSLAVFQSRLDAELAKWTGIAERSKRAVADFDQLTAPKVAKVAKVRELEPA